MWIERNAMAANAGARIERHEPERLRRRRANNFPSVYIQRITKPGHLVRHADVYGSKSVLQKFCRLPHARCTDPRNNGQKMGGPEFCPDLPQLPYPRRDVGDNVKLKL